MRDSKFNNNIVKAQILGWLNGLSPKQAYKIMTDTRHNNILVGKLFDSSLKYGRCDITTVHGDKLITTATYKNGAKVIFRHETSNEGISVVLLSTDKNMKDNTKLYHDIMNTICSLYSRGDK